MSIPRIELLAPAKDLQTGLAALRCGADAVYVGAPRFGARQAAGNDLEAIGQLIQHAHRVWARVYITLNTLLFDDEIPQAVDLAHQLYRLGADAIIIQDVGLLECDLPPIPLFASTQMHNHTPERVAFLEKAGIQRAILARELTLAEISAIRASTGIELECFIHGALCVSYSGQCYLSYALGGSNRARSGNRGQCAQPCRKTYRLEDESGKTILPRQHLLSLRDLNLSDDLDALLDAGITSFKIEGRLKDQSYVMNVVAHYRQQLDRLLQKRGWRKSSSGSCRFGFTPQPERSFNRGFTTYFLHGRGDSVTSWDTPKSKGESLGRVRCIQKESFILQPPSPAITPGDGLIWMDDQQELQGASVYRVEQERIYPEKMNGIAPGVEIYRNRDLRFETNLADPHSAARTLQVRFDLVQRGQEYWLCAKDEDGIESEVMAASAEPAKNPALAQERMAQQLMKLGDSDFAGGSLRCCVDEMPFLPVAEINRLRREAIRRLILARLEALPRPIGGPRLTTDPYPVSDGLDKLDFRANALNQHAVAFYRRHGLSEVEPGAESGLNLTGRPVMTTRYCLKYEMDDCPRKAASPRARKIPRAGERYFLVDDEGRRFAVIFRCQDCLMEIYPEPANP